MTEFEIERVLLTLRSVYDLKPDSAADVTVRFEFLASGEVVVVAGLAVKGREVGGGRGFAVTERNFIEYARGTGRDVVAAWTALWAEVRRSIGEARDKAEGAARAAGLPPFGVV